MSEENLFKLNISGGKQKSAKGLTKVIQLKDISPIVGKKIGEIINGGLIGLPGYELKITGGSDNSGIPMRFDVHGPVKKKVLLASGPCYNPDRSGKKRRKVVRGNEITDDMKQVNMVVEKFGKAKLFETDKEEAKE
ncbi:MAG: 30S ribosomal protein S6e [archaeon]|nr:30S ribosomal protein S6e [archaeon]